MVYNVSKIETLVIGATMSKQLNGIKPGDIITVPGPVFGRTRKGSRYMWRHALVIRVYNAKGGPAVEVEEAGPYKKYIKKYLVKNCKPKHNELYTQEFFSEMEFA
jgi:hypothetical protein